MTTQTINGHEFVDEAAYPVFFYAGNGVPAGISIAMFEDTELPVDPAELEGELDDDGDFVATNLAEGTSAHGWRFTDFNGSLIYKVQIFNDEKIWKQQRADWESEG